MAYTLGTVRRALAVVAGTVILIVVAWIIDDLVTGSDIPRGVEVNDVAVGSMTREQAAARLAMDPSLNKPITLVWDEASVTATASEYGISIDIESTLNEAAESGGATQPFRWLFSPVAHRRVNPHYMLDRNTLTGLLGEGTEAVLLVDPDGVGVALVDGAFVAADTAKVPIVDIAELERLLLAEVTAQSQTPVALPILGSEGIDVGGGELARYANKLTEGGIEVALVGFSEFHKIPDSALRQWVRFSSDGEVSLDNDSVFSTLSTLFVGLGDPGQQTKFFVDDADNIEIVGGAPGSVCCEQDTGERILEALLAGESQIRVRPTEDPDAKGLAWAESLGIKEVVGQFTTRFTPNQQRVVNIFRIAELTQGVVIEPGETFSVNDYVGPRTTENGFVPAGMILHGVFVDSVGGGISQYATTLFNAAFFAGLDFGRYQSHSIYLPRYPYGREATVSHPAPDLQIVNNTPHGVLIWPTVTEDSITVRLFSTRTVFAEQTGQTSVPRGLVCTNVYTERTRTYVADGRQEVDTVFASYHPEGQLCDGTPSVSTTTTMPEGDSGEGSDSQSDTGADNPNDDSGGSDSGTGPGTGGDGGSSSDGSDNPNASGTEPGDSGDGSDGAPTSNGAANPNASGTEPGDSGGGDDGGDPTSNNAANSNDGSGTSDGASLPGDIDAPDATPDDTPDSTAEDPDTDDPANGAGTLAARRGYETDRAAVAARQGHSA